MTEGIPGSQPPQGSQEQPGLKHPDSEQVAQHLKTHEEIKQMEALLEIAQNMVNNQLKDARSKGKHLAFNFEFIPPSGDAQQRGKIEAYNALQPQIATQIQSLAKLVAILKAGDPTSAPKCDALLDQLKEISKAFPQLSKEQGNTLNTLLENLPAQAVQASPHTQASFWQEIGNMCQKVTTENEQAHQALTAQLKNLQQTQAPQAEIQGTQTAANTIGGPQNLLATPPPPPAGSGKSESIAKQSMKAINQFMQKQNQYMADLIVLMALANMGDQIGNSLMAVTKDFQNAGLNYDLGQSMQKTGTATGQSQQYSGYSAAKQALAKEVAQANNDLSSLNSTEKQLSQAQNQIQSQINSINNNNELTPSQKAAAIKQLNAMKSRLTNMQANVKQGIADLQTLIHLLSNISFTQVGTTNNFTVSGPGGWSSQLSKDETSVVDGDTTTTPGPPPVTKTTGGLTRIGAEASDFQTTASGLQTTDQMTLQEHMTIMQQFWTAISTVLQTLNQSYMSVAQGISK